MSDKAKVQTYCAALLVLAVFNVVRFSLYPPDNLPHSLIVIMACMQSSIGTGCALKLARLTGIDFLKSEDHPHVQ